MCIRDRQKAAAYGPAIIGVHGLFLLLSLIHILILYTAGDTSTVLIIPFLGQLDLGLVYFPLCVVGIVYITNSVNLTDGCLLYTSRCV